MVSEYDYYDVYNEPNIGTWTIDGTLISGIIYDVENSEMENKSLEYCTWHEKEGLLKCVFNTALSESDKTILDTIVENNT